MSQIMNLTQGAQPSAKQTFYQKRAQARVGAAFPAFSFVSAAANTKAEAVAKNKSQPIPLYLVEKLQAVTKNVPLPVQREPLNLEQVTAILNANGVDLTDSAEVTNVTTESVIEKKPTFQPIPLDFIEEHQKALRHPSQFRAQQPDEPITYEQVFADLAARYLPKGYYQPKPQYQCPIPRTPRVPTVEDIINELAVTNWNRVFAALDKKDAQKLQALASDVGLDFPLLSPTTMAGRLPVLSTSNLPSASAQETSATASPARGSAMINSLFKSVRVPEFRFKWQFWAEKGQQSTPASKSTAVGGAEEYASRPKPLGDQIISVKEFYQHWNNIPVADLKLRDSIHLFHLGVKPLWEDPRNARGGAYYFRISKELAPDFWHEICLLAVGDVLQGAVETKRECKLISHSRHVSLISMLIRVLAAFNDDICGISYSVRWNAVQIAIWNRDAENEAGKAKLLATILEKLSERLQPKKDSYWYKAHKEHKGFAT